MNCDYCRAEMKLLFNGYYCPNHCDLPADKKAVARRKTKKRVPYLNLIRMLVVWLLQFLHLSSPSAQDFVARPKTGSEDPSDTTVETRSPSWAPSKSATPISQSTLPASASQPAPTFGIQAPPSTRTSSPSTGEVAPSTLSLTQTAPQTNPTSSPTVSTPPTPSSSPSKSPTQTFSATGWYQDPRVKQIPAYPGRIGGAIIPQAIVVHTTDTLTGTKPAIERSWSTTAGQGDCAHFIIGRDSVTQMVSIYRNANHAGGRIHGSWRGRNGSLVHPNTMAVGIDIECGGYLGRPNTAGQFTHPDTKTVVAPSEVYKDVHGVGWHRVTDYQLASLSEILDALEPLMPGPFPYTVLPDGGYAANNCAYYAPVADPQQIVGHCTLDPVNKTDPGPQVMAWLAARKALRVQKP